MKNKVLALLLCLGITVSLTACGGDAGSDESAAGGQDSSEAAGEAGEEAAESAGSDDFAGEELSIIVSADWMNDYYDETISRFEDTYSVTVDLQTIPADQYSDILQSKLETGTCTDVFWIQSNPFAIASVIGNPEEYCLDKINYTACRSGIIRRSTLWSTISPCLRS